MRDFKDLWHDQAIAVVLRSTTTSPYGRKVRMALIELGLEQRVIVQAADTLDHNDNLRQQNPLGKMPCLLIGKDIFYDSHVILEMLDSLNGPSMLIPATGLARYRALTQARLADGITDAALLVTYERRFRDPSQSSERWLDHQRGKIQRGLSVFEHTPPDAERADLVAITLAACLGYLSWRQPLDWRTDYPRLASWLDTFANAHPCWAATRRLDT